MHQFDPQAIFGIASVIVAFVQYVPYIRNILLGKTKPHAFSWLAWTLPTAIVFAAQLFNKGVATGSWATGITAFLCIIVFVLSLWRGEKTITRLDTACVVLALISIGLWLITDDPLGAVIIASITYILGLIPTWRKSIDKPYEETLSTYLVGNVKWLLSLLAFKSYSFTTLLYPVLMMAAPTSFALLLIIRRRQLRKYN